ncbi:MAG: polysaccharide deacetylase family protein [Thermonemataceae bacterium]
MYKTFIVWLLCFIYFSSNAQNKQICITIDDLPVVTYGSKKEGIAKYITQKLVDTLQKYQVPAIGYVNERQLYNKAQLDAAKVSLLAYWLERGQSLGNHTYAHTNYHQSTFEAYKADILKGEKITRPLALEYNQALKYFRHPYLKMGQTKERADSLQAFLVEKGYVESPVTIDNEDYLFAKAYAKAARKKDTQKMKTIGEAYLQYTQEKLTYYERLTQQIFEREIAQTLLIHVNLLNADYMPSLLQLFKKSGYTFISQTAVLKDKAYQTPVTAFGDWGISWLERWALSTGKGKGLLKESPKVPSFILEDK